MSVSRLLRLLRLPGSFLLPEADDLRRIVGDEAAGIPLPQRIFFEDEDATPVSGYPVLLADRSRDLRATLENWAGAEARHELERLASKDASRRRADTLWGEYELLLNEATHNAVFSSFGRGFPSIFWLYHSIAVSRVFKQIPAGLRRVDLEAGKEYGGSIKYRVFSTYLDRVLSLTYEIVQSAASTGDESEERIFPALLHRMRDNVLILTEDHIASDLRELVPYLENSLRVDAASFRESLQALTDWHARELQKNGHLRRLVKSLPGRLELNNPNQLLLRPGYVTFLAARKPYNKKRLMNPEQVALWERLLLRLKEFELLADLRRYVVPTESREGRYRCAGGVLRGLGTKRKEVVLSHATRPLDFINPLVVDPVVRRFGLIYDITDFSAIISILRRSGTTAQDLSFRRIFRFQSRVNRLAAEHKARLEKYLGDGALYSGRHPQLLLAAAVRVQRFYRKLLEQDFPFDRGMRIALNYGRYRLMPFEGGGGRTRYEFFGHGIVELTRLVTGKTTRELDEVRTFLLAQGYSPLDVDNFFEPLLRRDVRLTDAESERPFHAFIDHSGALVNEGIVATESFVDELDRVTPEKRLGLRTVTGHEWIVFDVEDEAGDLTFGLRKLGEARLKGLGKVPILEVADAGEWPPGETEELPAGPLIALAQARFNDSRLARLRASNSSEHENRGDNR